MTSFVSEMLSIIAERGRNLVSWPKEGNNEHSIIELSHALLSEKGEASSIAIAVEIFSLYGTLSREERITYFHILETEFSANHEKIKASAAEFLSKPNAQTTLQLHQSTEPRRQELFRRLNHAPNGTKSLVKMRKDLLPLLKEYPEFKKVDLDFLHLFSSWFNRGFLVLQRITWDTPATILEKIIEYEAVHEIDSWEELRRRIQPKDRRCYAFFHPALTDDPLIFVEVALTSEISKSVERVLDKTREPLEKLKANTAVFYSISNCQAGLKGVSFGHFLIKQVVEELLRELPQIKTFVTLSPIPGFMSWLKKQITHPEENTITFSDDEIELINDIELGVMPEEFDRKLQKTLLPVAAEYFINVKQKSGKPIDPVARFHLGNGAQLEHLNWAADCSKKGLIQSAGMMVNYLYDPAKIEHNHQSYANNDNIIASSNITSLLLSKNKIRER